MELNARAVRQSGMMTRRRVGTTGMAGVLCAGTLCAVLAGCGSVTASSAGAGGGAAGAGGGGGAAGAGASASARPATSGAAADGAAAGGAAAAGGCGDVSQATTVTIRRGMHLVEPVRASGLTVTQRNSAMVRALFRDLCDAVGHPYRATGVTHCPASFGMSYTGTFYAGSQELATFVYGASGCQTVSVTADGKQRSTLLSGPAAAAAPRLQADLATVLGVPKYAVGAPGMASPGGGGGPAKLRLVFP
jgi:hypothetical protein